MSSKIIIVDSKSMETAVWNIKIIVPLMTHSDSKR